MGGAKGKSTALDFLGAIIRAEYLTVRVILESHQHNNIGHSFWSPNFRTIADVTGGLACGLVALVAHG